MKRKIPLEPKSARELGCKLFELARLSRKKPGASYASIDCRIKSVNDNHFHARFGPLFHIDFDIGPDAMQENDNRASCDYRNLPDLSQARENSFVQFFLQMRLRRFEKRRRAVQPHAATQEVRTQSEEKRF